MAKKIRKEQIDGLDSFYQTLSVGTGMGQLDLTFGGTVYVNSIAISNKQDANTHPKNSGGLQAFSYNAPSALNYPVVAGSGGGGGISFYRNNTAGGLLSSFDIVKAEHSEEKLRFRVGISTTAKGDWKTVASEEYVTEQLNNLTIGNYITRNTQETVNAKKQWTTAQTFLRENNIRHIYNIANSVGTIGSLAAVNYFLINFGNPLISVMWEAEIEIYEYSSAVGINANKTRVKRFLITGYDLNTSGILYNRSVTQTCGDTDAIESITYFRDGNGSIVLGFKSVNTWAYPKVNFKRLSLHHSQTNVIENAVAANASVTYTNDVSTLTSYYVVPNANIIKNVDSSNVNTLVTDTNNYVDIIQTTNGTTAGTVYTFKRVGLSDLTLTLTAASASFSGVVTTGTQTFEGVKTFLKSPKVPIAVNSDEAVNKAQMDAADVNGNAAYSFGDHRLAGYWNIKNPTGYIGLTDLNLAIGGSRGLAQPTVANTTHAGFSDIVTISQYSTDDLLQLELPFRNNGYFGFRTKSTAGWTNMTYLWHSDNFNPAQYVMISALNTTLAGYATLAGTQTFTGQITYTQAPIVPNGTLLGHTVNLGQLNLKADKTYVDQQIQQISLTPGPQGTPGTNGTNGTNGTDGKTWLSGTTVPVTGLGVIGDFYLNTATWEVYEKTTATVWTSRGNIKGATGNNGTNGAPGTNGTNGTNGTDGKTWYSGTAAPANGTGVTGDWYLNRTTWDVYEKTGASAWTLRGNIKGATGNNGAPGTNGTNGTNGNTWLSGISVPATGTGTVGDWYINYNTWDVYEKTGTTTWTLRGNIKGTPGTGGGGGNMAPVDWSQVPVTGGHHIIIKEPVTVVHLQGTGFLGITVDDGNKDGDLLHITICNSSESLEMNWDMNGVDKCGNNPPQSATWKGSSWIWSANHGHWIQIA